MNVVFLSPHFPPNFWLFARALHEQGARVLGVGDVPVEQVGAEQLGTPLKFLDVDLPSPTKAPTVGQHTDAVLADVLGLDDQALARLREAGALG